MYRKAVGRGQADAAVTERLMLLWTAAEAARLTNARAAAQIGGEPGPEGSIAKVQMADPNKAIYELCVDLSGDDGLLIDTYADIAPAFAAVHGRGRRAQVVPTLVGQLHRGLHLRGAAQHPRRAGARAARRTEGRPGHPVEGRASLMISSFDFSGRTVLPVDGGMSM